MFRLFRKKGQSAIEYAVMFVAIVVALLVMQTWIKRAMQGRLRSTGDDIGEQFGDMTSYNYTTNRHTLTTEDTTVANKYLLTYNTDRTVKTGSEAVPNADKETWSW